MSFTLNFYGDAYQYRVCKLPERLKGKVTLEDFANGFLNFDFLEQLQILSKEHCFVSDEFICPLINTKTRFEIKNGRKIVLKDLTFALKNEGLLFSKYTSEFINQPSQLELKEDEFLYIQKTVGSIGSIKMNIEDFNLNALQFKIVSNFVEHDFLTEISYNSKRLKFSNNNVLTQFETCIVNSL